MKEEKMAIKTTRKQREALFKIFQRDFPNWVTPTLRRSRIGILYKVPSFQYRKFLKTCTPELGGFGAVMVPWHSMWLGVEKDGYTHS